MTHDAKKSYALSTNYHAINRQNAQFYIWTDNDFVLHPRLPVKQSNLRVAEIGVGTGIWLTQISRLLPKCARIDGFDINLAACPPEEWLPSNVSTKIHDCLKPFPEALKASYDIVHVQLFHLAIQDGDPTQVLHNLVEILKPGGYLSWGEYDYSRWSLVRTDIADQRDLKLTELMEYSGTMGDSRPSWTRNYWPAKLPKLFEQQGLCEVVIDNRDLSLELLQYQLSTALAACEEMSYNVLDSLSSEQGNKMRELIKHVASQQKSIAYNVGRLTVLGKKQTRINAKL